MQGEQYNEEKFKSKIDTRLWGKILHRLADHKTHYAVILCIMGLLAVADIVNPLIVRHIIDECIAKGDVRGIYQSGGVYLAVVLAQTILVWAFISGCGSIGVKVMADLRIEIFARLQTLSVSFYNRTPVGWLLSRLMGDVQRVGETITWGAVDLTWGFLMMSLMAVVMLMVHWRLAVAVLILVPLIVFVSIKFQSMLLESYRRIRRLNSEITTNYNESLNGVRVIKTLGQEENAISEFSATAHTMFEASVRSAVLASLYLPIVNVVSMLGSAITINYGGSLVLGGTLTMGTLVAFITYIRRFFDPINEMARVFGQLQETQASAERLFSLLETEPEVKDGLKVKPGKRITGLVEFRNVNFTYNGGQQVLRNFSLKIHPGTVVALVGPTGGGKTTIANLVLRFYDPTAGKVLIDGVDLRTYQQQWLRAHFGVVLQTPHLFTGTIKDNIRYGRLDASDDQIKTIAEAVGAHDFIAKLPEAYETHLGENGDPLSTGQKQLISLARAFLADPAIFIMDEATSSVDTETERRIQQATERLLEGRTSFVIAHRLSTIRRADRILVIENGRITESGTHPELLARKGHYFNLYSQQYLGQGLEG